MALENYIALGTNYTNAFPAAADNFFRDSLKRTGLTLTVMIRI